LKLTGGDRSKGSGVLCPGAHELSFNNSCVGGRVARSLKRDPLGGACLNSADPYSHCGEVSNQSQYEEAL